MGSYRVALNVEEQDVNYLRPGQQGRFAPTGLAGDTVPFTVRRITSVTSNVDGQNLFRVEAELAGGRQAVLRPGMEGVATETGRASCREGVCRYVVISVVDVY